MKTLLIAILSVVFITGCAPEIGSKEWCADLKEKPKGEWTLDETTDYTKHCIFQSEE
ncbi:DUF3012 domain-containing protein [Colwelliaceae bacterium 6471]